MADFADHYLKKDNLYNYESKSHGSGVIKVRASAGGLDNEFRRYMPIGNSN